NRRVGLRINISLSALPCIFGAHATCSSVLSLRHPRRAALRHSQGWFRRQYRHTFGTADDPGHAAPAGGGDTVADTLHHGPGGTADLPRALEPAESAHHSAGGAGRHGAGLGGLSLDERGAYPADDRHYRAGLHPEYLAASGR